MIWLLTIPAAVVGYLAVRWWLRREPSRDDFQLDQVALDGGLWIEHRQGIWWHKARHPGIHLCTVWTRSAGVERCACGAIRRPGGYGYGWMERSWSRRGRIDDNLIAAAFQKIIDDG